MHDLVKRSCTKVTMVALPSHMTQEVFLRKFHADVIIPDFALENKLLTGAVNTAGNGYNYHLKPSIRPHFQLNNVFLLGDL